MGLFTHSSTDVYVRGKRVKVDPSASIGKGGEADVYDLGRGVALKLWKGPDHPDYAGEPEAQAAARRRLDAHQSKLPAFPSGLPSRVITPVDVATDKSGSRLVGYTMPLVSGAEVLLKFAEPGYRAAHVEAWTLGPMLADLHRTVESLHQKGVVIGDFNDLNVLVRVVPEGPGPFSCPNPPAVAYVIDTDSFQIGGFDCEVYTERFLDPLLADPKAARPCLSRRYGPESDWYAFAVMVMQTLLCVGPYGGIYRPRAASDRIPHDARPLRRITVFHPEVTYPKPAIPWSVLPDELLHALSRTFEKDERSPLPRRLLESLVWRRCDGCGMEHARALCPKCVQTVISAATTTTTGKVTRVIVRTTAGRVICAAVQDGKLRYLVHEGGRFVREDGGVVLSGALDPALRFWLRGEETLVGRGGEIVALQPSGKRSRFVADVVAGTAAVATSARHRVRAHGGQLLSTGPVPGMPPGMGEDIESRVGDVLPGQTRVWSGDRFGFGLYRAGGLSVAFVFRQGRAGLTDSVKLPYPAGQVLEHEVVFSEDRVWVLFSVQTGPKTMHIATQIAPDGTIEATAQHEAGDGTWLGTLGGKCAVGRVLLCPTDTGVVRVEAQGTALSETRRFVDTEPFVTAASELCAGPDGLFVVEPRTISMLRLG